MEGAPSGVALAGSPVESSLSPPTHTLAPSSAGHSEGGQQLESASLPPSLPPSTVSYMCVSLEHPLVQKVVSINMCTAFQRRDI